MPRCWRVAPHGSITPGRAYCRARDPLLAFATVQAFPTSVGTMPSADSAARISANYAALRPFPWHATSLGTEEASRGKRSHRRCIDARLIKHSPFVEGGLCGCVPARPDCPTPCIGFLSVAPPLRSTLPSDPTLRGRPCASLVLRLHVHLDRGLTPPSMTACTAHTPRIRRGE